MFSVVIKGDFPRKDLMLFFFFFFLKNVSQPVIEYTHVQIRMAQRAPGIIE